MKHVRSFIPALVGVLACVFVCGAQAQQPQQGAKAATAKPNLLVGVIDLRAVVSNHPIIADNLPELGRQMQALEVEVAKAQQEAQDKLNKLQQELKAGTDEYNEQMNLIRKNLTDVQFKAQDAQEKLIVQRTQYLFKAYKDIQSAVRAVALQNGILIVHTKIKVTPAENANVPEEVVALQEADNNTIVWNRPECDITEQVKQALAATVGAPKQQAPESPLSNLGGQALSAAQAAPAQNTAAPAAPKTALNPNAAGQRAATPALQRR